MKRSKFNRSGFSLLLAAMSAVVILPPCGLLAGDAQIYLAFDGYNGTIGGVNYNVAAFNAANLNAEFTADDEAAMEDRIFTLVRDAFTDFRVDVRTSAPGVDNHMVIAIGSDANGNQFGLAPSIDSDPYDMDYARVWAGSFKQYPAFQDIFSTVQRYGNAIGEVAAHEAGHNYGLDHWQATPTPGEQGLGVLASDHLMSTWPTVTEWQRANDNRVFGDRSYGALAATVGLKNSLLFNGMWSNNNNVAAHDLHIIVLSNSDSMTVKEWGGVNPFTQCQIVALGTEQYGGQTYNKYRVDFSGGQVPSGVCIDTTVSLDEQFTIWPTPGAFQPTVWLVRDAYFTDANSQPLPVRPRNISIQEHFDFEAGEFRLGFRNDSDLPMQLTNLHVLLNPRMVPTGDMTFGGIPTGTGVWLPPVTAVTLAPGQEFEMVLGDLEEWMAGPFGPGGGGGGGGDFGDPGGGACSQTDVSVFRGMFPSCYWTAEAEVTTFGVLVWNEQLGQYVPGNVTDAWVWQSAGMPVPEPAALSMLVLGGLALLRRRR